MYLLDILKYGKFSMYVVLIYKLMSVQHEVHSP